MKIRKYIYIILVICLFVFLSCFNDLDVLFLDFIVEIVDKVYIDVESYIKGFYKIYLVWVLFG